MERKSSPEPGTGTLDADDRARPVAAADRARPVAAADRARPMAAADDRTRPMAAADDAPPGPKRYRPAPAKTFQCRGYGDCRMVFSRSEHLARHIRKHTGERPFTCHCSKQFSRLDNLRQHAQTVHADKQDQNERMMRDLTSLHASMAAANKISNARTARRIAADADADRAKQEQPAATAYDPAPLYPQWQPEFPSRPSTSERLPPLSSIVPQQPAFPRPRPATAGRPSSSSTFVSKSFYDAAPEPSPFYFAPPDTRSSTPEMPRKCDDYSHHPLDYDYGSESRPQSRRLSVMELCNNAAGGLVDAYLDHTDRPPALGLVHPMSVFDRPRRPSPARSAPRPSPPASPVPTPHLPQPSRPHSTAFSSTSSNGTSPPVPGTYFAYPQQPHPYAPLHLVANPMPSVHHQYTPSPAPPSYYHASPRSSSSSFSPRSPAHMAHQQAQAFQALHAGAPYAHAHPQGYPYDYPHGYSA